FSAIYLDASKDRLYADAENGLSRRSCQTVMWKTVNALARMLAPVLSFTSEEIWQQLRTLDASLPESVFLSTWPESNAAERDDALIEKWEKVKFLRSVVSKALEAERAAGKIGQALEARVVVAAPQFYKDAMSLEDWAMVCITSGFEFAPESVKSDEEIKVEVFPAKGTKCPRCWRYEESHHHDGLCSRCAHVVENN
ncbi:MAG: class I tRNA ligase family protein, partial [Pyramidobacter sp.]|nr:class I tRNA ligase family protein [Pyramidobacter sp.]